MLPTAALCVSVQKILSLWWNGLWIFLKIYLMYFNLFFQFIQLRLNICVKTYLVRKWCAKTWKTGKPDLKEICDDVTVCLESERKQRFPAQPWPSGRSPPWRGSDAVIWLRSDAAPGAVSAVDPGRAVDTMFLSVPGLRALFAALSLFVFPAESCHSLPPLPCHHSASPRM